MPELPQAVAQLNSLLGAATIAHEAIFEMRRDLLARDEGNAEHARLVAESAQIVTAELPRLTAVARQLSAQWREQDLLDRRGARRTLAALETELVRIEPDADALLSRQQAIAGQLRSMRAQ